MLFFRSQGGVCMPSIIAPGAWKALLDPALIIVSTVVFCLLIASLRLMRSDTPDPEVVPWWKNALLNTGLSTALVVVAVCIGSALTGGR